MVQEYLPYIPPSKRSKPLFSWGLPSLGCTNIFSTCLCVLDTVPVWLESLCAVGNGLGDVRPQDLLVRVNRINADNLVRWMPELEKLIFGVQAFLDTGKSSSYFMYKTPPTSKTAFISWAGVRWWLPMVVNKTLTPVTLHFLFLSVCACVEHFGFYYSWLAVSPYYSRIWCS